ncbi:hypothetical protein [Actinoplanes sp. NPDC023714]|uniref:hypothetical protein n=1 Tax=Actinoplanes sp. NPDC023714 TaxID=3154322 RepID=UPI0033FB0230
MTQRRESIVLGKAALAIAIAMACVACSGPSARTAEPTPAPPSTSPVISPDEASPETTSPPAQPAEATTTTTTTTATPPRKPTGDPDKASTWLNALADCPNEGQKPQIQQILRKDATGDGAVDTLIARTCEASTSYIPSTVEIFDGTKRIAILLEDVGPTDLPWYRSMTVNDETVAIEAYGVSEGGVPACADLKLTYTYRHANGAFERTGRKETKVDDLCLPVG